MGRACGTNGEKRNACRLLMGKAEGKSPLGRPRRRWKNGSVKVGLTGMWSGHSGSTKCLEVIEKASYFAAICTRPAASVHAHVTVLAPCTAGSEFCIL
jgi:hypothetical protein